MDTERAKPSLWTWKATGAVCGFAGGILAALLGGLLTASTWILGAELHPWLQKGGTALLFSTIPLLIFAGYCLDWMERKPKSSAGKGSGNAERGSIRVSRLILLGGLLSVFTVAPLKLHAQQTIFNVPTTDVLDKGKVYAELDVSFKPVHSETVNRFSSFVPRVVVGTGGHVEVGLNITGNVQPGADTTTLVPTAKWRFFEANDNGLALVVGDNLFIPVRNLAYTIGNYVYAEFSKTFKPGTRMTLGGYHFTPNVVAPANRAGGQFGFEQSLNKKVTLAADWFTGKHSAGYFTPGIVFKIGPKVTGYAGYSIGNQNASRGNHFFLLEVGYNFN